jgi:hypothetical protein
VRQFVNRLRRKPSATNVKRKRIKAALDDDFRVKVVVGQ